jgi:hypothetical protein
MHSSSSSRRRSARDRRMAAIVLALGALVALSLGIANALAAHPKSGNWTGQFKYKGTLITSEALTFKVSGNKVKKFAITPFLPNKCGSGGPPPKEKSKNATIHKGKFSGAAEVVFQGKVTGKTKVSGKFTSSKKATGTLKTTFPSTPQCAASYTFTAKPATGG